MKYTNVALATAFAFACTDSAWALRGSGRQLAAPSEPKGPKDPPPPSPGKPGPPAKGGSTPGKPVKGEARTIDADLGLLIQLATADKGYGHGSGFACRHNSAGEGGPGTYEDGLNNQYFEAQLDVETLTACKALCNANVECVAVEYGHNNQRCELWKADVGDTVDSSSFGCYRKFEGAKDAVCRPDHSLIKGGPYDPLTADGEYYEIVEADDLGDCQEQCGANPDCTGVGYNECSEECELWKVEIGGILPVKGNACFRKVTTDYDPNATEDEVVDEVVDEVDGEADGEGSD